MGGLDRLVWPVVRLFFHLPVVSFFGQPQKFVADLFAETENGTTGPGEELRLTQTHIDMQEKLLIKNLSSLRLSFPFNTQVRGKDPSHPTTFMRDKRPVIDERRSDFLDVSFVNQHG